MFIPHKRTRNDPATRKGTRKEPFKDLKATMVAATLASDNLPTNRTRELIKPSTDSASLRLEIEKKFFGLGFGFFVCYVTMRACLSNFRPALPNLSPNAKIFPSMFLWILDSKTSL